MDVIEIPWDQAQRDLKPNDVIIYEHKSRQRFGEANVVETKNGIEIVANCKKYTSADWSPSKWVKENITTSVPPGGHLQYVKVRRQLFEDTQSNKIKVKKEPSKFVEEKDSNDNNFSPKATKKDIKPKRVVFEEDMNKKPFQVKTEPKRKYISESERKEIFDRTQGTCYLCKKRLPERGWHVEHIIPFSKYPEMDHGGNYLPACATCNLQKGARNLDTVINDKNFTVLTSVLSNKELHPDVLALLKKAKEEKHKNGKPSFAAICLDLDQDVLFDIEDALGYLPLYESLEVKQFNVLLIQEQHVETFQLDERDFDLNKMKKLSRGGRGIVKSYTWNNQQVAIKEAKSSDSENELEKEIKMLSKLHHPNILTCLGYFKKLSGIHMVMDLMPYDLGEWIKNEDEPYERNHKKNLPNLDYEKIATEIAEALSYLHSQDILHRDLKPSNVLLDDTLTVKLADFGCSTVSDSDCTLHGRTKVDSGSDWTAPELRKYGQCSKASDMYSFGKILKRLGQESDSRELLELGEQCTVRDPHKRLPIETVMKKLKNL